MYITLIEPLAAFSQDGTWSTESKYDGTLLYASPQQLLGAETAKSDDVWPAPEAYI